MANSDNPKGFQPIGEFSLVKYTAGARIVPGEFVRLASDGKLDPVAAGETILGLAMSLAKNDGDEVMVCDDPHQRYVGQADETHIDAQTDVGNLCDVLATADNTIYDSARMEIDSSTIGTGSGGQLLILDVQERTDNTYGEFADVIVRINENQLEPSDFAGV